MERCEHACRYLPFRYEGSATLVCDKERMNSAVTRNNLFFRGEEKRKYCTSDSLNTLIPWIVCGEPELVSSFKSHFDEVTRKKVNRLRGDDRLESQFHL